eukprot:CAMPEP_0114553570 /NCGR_PEP_ID=MMETSP0114-20121206/7735_1 /TAXON_ID=31324 /ORGANISM="Goniomonas sp, Strain m" /LENGTH=687 /DNA_ID=CAMNT_0001738535 /DNA_START=120 /DNA_END=2183 /DNA_ORIENTATION=+
MPMPSQKEVKLEELSRYFHLPEKVVAKELGICLTSLKKLCRSYGITRWPFRKLKSLERTMRKARAEQGSVVSPSLEGAARAEGSGSVVDDDEAEEAREVAAGALAGTSVDPSQRSQDESDPSPPPDAQAATSNPPTSAGGPRKRKAYSVGTRTVFLSDEERQIVQMTLGPQYGMVPGVSHGHDAGHPIGTGEQGEESEQAATALSLGSPLLSPKVFPCPNPGTGGHPPRPFVAPGLHSSGQSSSHPGMSSVSRLTGYTEHLSPLMMPRSHMFPGGYPPLPQGPSSEGQGLNILQGLSSSLGPGAAMMGLGAGYGFGASYSTNGFHSDSRNGSPRARRGEFDAVVVDSDLFLFHWASLWSEDYLRTHLLLPLGGTEFQVAEDMLRCQLRFKSPQVAHRARQICLTAAAASAAAAAAMLRNHPACTDPEDPPLLSLAASTALAAAGDVDPASAPPLSATHTPSKEHGPSNGATNGSVSKGKSPDAPLHNGSRKQIDGESGNGDDKGKGTAQLDGNQNPASYFHGWGGNHVNGKRNGANGSGQTGSGQTGSGQSRSAPPKPPPVATGATTPCRTTTPESASKARPCSPSLPVTTPESASKARSCSPSLPVAPRPAQSPPVVAGTVLAAAAAAAACNVKAEEPDSVPHPGAGQGAEADSVRHAGGVVQGADSVRHPDAVQGAAGAAPRELS